MNRERLEHTARKVLPFLDPKKFYMGTWRDKRRCGTVCCAFGAEALSPYGQQQGLSWGNGMATPYFNGYSEVSAAMYYYEIDYETACWLFLSGSYIDTFAYDETCQREVMYVSGITPAHVAARIETLLACEG